MIDPIRAMDAIAYETMLFASVGLLLGGVDDLLVDLLFLAGWARRRAGSRVTLDGLVPRGVPARLAVFVAAWDESAVIGAMLANAVARFDHPDYRIYVGVYPNDRGTIDAAAAVAEGDSRIRIVVGPHDGPTTKADCLNTLWRAMIRADAAGIM